MTESKRAFSARTFVNRILDEGSTIACDDSNESFPGTDDNYAEKFDEERFKRGQKFFNDYMFPMFFGKMLGLFSIFAIPSVAKVLMFTHKSSDPLASYRRYLATVMHLFVWYREDFKPDSDLWKSISEVKNKHNATSKRCCNIGFDRITQKDMALTQCAFFGFIVAKPQELGIFDAPDERFADLVYVWQVIGRLMGIEERFNLCRDSLEETRAICGEIIAQVFRPEIERQRPDFITLSKSFIGGLWAMCPYLDHQIFMIILLKLVNQTKDIPSNRLIEQKLEALTRVKTTYLWMVESSVALFKYRIYRTYQNYVMILSLWLMTVFPFLAFYKFGKRNSFVTILNRTERSNKSG